MTEELAYGTALARTENPFQDSKQELVPTDIQDKEQQFNKLIKYLNYLAHEIDDIGAVAARLINERRAKYNFFFEQNKQFLREYALEHMKRDADGNIKGRNYKSVAAGGGVYFRAKPEKITIDQESLEALWEIVKKFRGEIIASSLVANKPIMSFVTNEKALISTLTEIIKERANEKLEELKQTVTDMTEEQSQAALEDFIKQGEAEIFDDEIIDIEPAEELATMTVGNTKGWTGKDVKTQLNKAIDGKIIDKEDVDEVEALIEELE